ncbi:hypothetical protein D3C72_1909380 [compost metagenome]
MISTRNRSAVSRVRKAVGKLVSMPSSSIPPNGGLATMQSTRSAGPQLINGRPRVLSCLIWLGTSMPCRIMLVVASRWGSGFFSTPKILACRARSTSAVCT